MKIKIFHFSNNNYHNAFVKCKYIIENRNNVLCCVLKFFYSYFYGIFRTQLGKVSQFKSWKNSNNSKTVRFKLNLYIILLSKLFSSNLDVSKLNFHII